VRLRPAREISGDVYDFFEFGDEYAIIAFGDVSGKSAAAALYGAMVSGVLRTMAPRRRSPAQLLHSLNESLLERRVDARYATLTVMLWQASTRLLTMANAGGLPPLICRRGEIIEPRLEGVPLGLLDGSKYEDTPFQTEPGDVILLVSDGILDQFNPAEEEYGKQRLAKLLRRVHADSAEGIAAAVLADLDQFTAGVSRFDDQTLAVLKVNSAR